MGRPNNKDHLKTELSLEKPQLHEQNLEGALDEKKAKGRGPVNKNDL